MQGLVVLISFLGGGVISYLRRPWYYVLILAGVIDTPIFVYMLVDYSQREVQLPPYGALLSFLSGFTTFTIYASIGFGIVELIKLIIRKAKAP